MRCSEREPAGSLRDKSNVVGGWLPSLTFMFGNHMTRSALYGLLLVLVLTACSSSTGSKHVSAAKFERSFTRSQTVAMQHFYYNGETNGCVYISRIARANWWYYSKRHWETLFTETNRVPEAFMREVRASRPQQGGPPTNYIFKPKAERGGPGDAGFRLSVFSCSVARRA